MSSSLELLRIRSGRNHLDDADLRAGARCNKERTAGFEDLLSLRELEILNLLPAGLTNKEIATRLFISPETVKTHIAHILKKTGARNRTEAACLVAALGRQNAGHFPGQGSRASLPVAAENGVSYEAISSQANEKKISSEVYK